MAEADLWAHIKVTIERAAVANKASTKKTVRGGQSELNCGKAEDINMADAELWAHSKETGTGTAGKKKAGGNGGQVKNPYKIAGMVNALDTRFQGRLGTGIRAGDPVMIKIPARKQVSILGPVPPRSVQSQRQPCIISFSSLRRPNQSASDHQHQ
jgi:hypothetical protein